MAIRNLQYRPRNSSWTSENPIRPIEQALSLPYEATGLQATGPILAVQGLMEAGYNMEEAVELIGIPQGGQTTSAEVNNQLLRAASGNQEGRKVVEAGERMGMYQTYRNSGSISLVRLFDVEPFDNSCFLFPGLQLRWVRTTPAGQVGFIRSDETKVNWARAILLPSGRNSSATDPEYVENLERVSRLFGSDLGAQCNRFATRNYVTIPVAGSEHRTLFVATISEGFLTGISPFMKNPQEEGQPEPKAPAMNVEDDAY